MEEPIFLDGEVHEKIWGGKKLHELFGYGDGKGKMGEKWGISAHKNGDAKVLNSSLKGETLSSLWEKHREYFGGSTQAEFPLLTKILDASEDLSVQVHPDDEYGKAHAGEQGKTECWYVIAAEPGAEIIYGHNAKTKEEFEKLASSGEWDKLLHSIPVKAGDFYYVPSGTVHAIGAGIVILETQQSSDTTYRLYDYDRVEEATGKTRPLQITESLDVTTVPHHVEEMPMKKVISENMSMITLVESPYFNVFKWEVRGAATMNATGPYTLISVISGTGHIRIDDDSYDLKAGDHLVLPTDVTTWKLKGNMEIIASTPGEKNR